MKNAEKEKQEAAPPKQISPRISVMNMQKGKEVTRRGSAFTLEYRQLRTEADETFFTTLYAGLKQKVMGKPNKIAAEESEEVAVEAPKEEMRKKKKRSSVFSVNDDLLSDKLQKPKFMINPIGHIKVAWDAFVI